MNHSASHTTDMARRWILYLYSAALLLSAIYRLYLPDPLGDYLFYLVAFAAPVIAACLMMIFEKVESKIILALMAVVVLIVASWILSSSDEAGFTVLLHGLKVYLVPLLMFKLGYSLALATDRKTFMRLIVGILSVQLIFSLIYYYGLLDNPMYHELSGEFSENWVITAGDMKAFIGLTLSKFDLAYQIGFILVGLIFSRDYFKTNSVLYYLCLMIGLILVIFTYNKTIMAVLLLVAVVWIYSRVQQRTRMGARLWLLSLVILIAILAILFLTRQISFADSYKFLTPQTFWSRVFGWYEAFHYDVSCIWSGYGAGYFDMNKVILDSQYLYTYLEMGLLAAICYFWLFAYFLYQYSTKDIFAKTFIALLFIIFVGGDILGAVAVTYIGGLYFGQFVRAKRDTIEAYENRR